MSDGLSVKEISNQHKKTVRNIKTANDLEVKKLQVAHQKRVNDIKNQNEIQMINIKSQFENKRGQELQRNEKILEQLKQNVEDTKKVTDREINNLQNNFNKRKSEITQNFEEQFDNQKITNTLKMQELNESSNIDLQKLQRKVSLEKNKIESSGQSEKRVVKAKYQNQIQSDKNNYFKKAVAQDSKFQKSLLKQKKDHVEKLAFEERKNQQMIKNKEEQFKKQIDLLTKDSVNKRENKRQSFEQQYNKIHKENEGFLQKLVGKKEQIFNALKKEVVREYSLALDRSNDSFYDFSKLDPIVEKGETGYKISIPVPKEEAQSVSLQGENRTLTITFERKNEFKNDEENGTVNSLNKYESYVSKVPVEYIVDPKSLTKSFSNGMVVFNIAYK